jgi:hypothetical protein
VSIISAYCPGTPVAGRLNLAGILKGGGRVAVGVAVDSRLPRVREGGALGVFPEGKADALDVRVRATTVAEGDDVRARTVDVPEALMAGLPVTRLLLDVCVLLALGEREVKELREGLELTDGERVPASVLESEGADVEDALEEEQRDAAAERLEDGVELSCEEALAEGEIDLVARGDAEVEALREPDPVGDVVRFTEKDLEGLPEDVLEAVMLRVSVGLVEMEGVCFVVKERELRGVLDTLRERTEGVAVELRERSGENVAEGLVRGARLRVAIALDVRVARGLFDAPTREPDAVREGFDAEGLLVPDGDAVFVEVLETVPEGAAVMVRPLTLRRLEPVAEAEPDWEKRVAVPEGVEEGVLPGAVRESVSPKDALPHAEAPERDAVGLLRKLPEALREAAAEALLQAEVLAVLDAEAENDAFVDELPLIETENVDVGDTDDVADKLLLPLRVALVDVLGLTVLVLSLEDAAELVGLPENVLPAVAVAVEETHMVNVGLLLPLAESEREMEEHGVDEVEPHAERVNEGDAEAEALADTEAQLAEGDKEGVMVCVSDRDAVDVEEGVTEVVASQWSEVSAIWSQMPPVRVDAQNAPPGLLELTPPVWHQ